MFFYSICPKQDFYWCTASTLGHSIFRNTTDGSPQKRNNPNENVQKIRLPGKVEGM